MYKRGLDTITVNGLTMTRDDLEARVISNKCSLDKSKNAYVTCCKKILPGDKLFKC